MTPETLDVQARKAGFTLPETAMPVLCGYLEELTRWNKVMNLVGGRSETQIFPLFLDSFHLADFLTTLPLPSSPETWDLGAGAGLPGIPLRSVWQAGRYIMVESREKRALFLQTTLAHHPLPGTSVFHGRAESLMDTSAPVDMILSRAFMPPEKLLPFVQPHLKPGGLLVMLLNAPLSPEPSAPWQQSGILNYTVGNASRCLQALSLP